MISDLRDSRELAWRLFVRDITAQYRQTVLGYLWAFLPPIATSLTFVFLNSQNILSITETALPYPAFVLIGTTLWQTFVDAINSPLKLVQSSKAMLAKINFPREALVLAGLGEVFFNFAVRSLILVVTLLWFQLLPTATILLVPLGIICLVALGLAFGILLTPIGMLYQDIGRGLTLVAGFWMLLTPVVYPSPKTWPASALSHWNPVSPIINATRAWFTGGTFTDANAFIFVIAATLPMLCFGWFLYRVSMPHLIERMSG